MQDTGLVLNIQKFCLHDGPGLRTTVFLKGCPLACKWCANPESQSAGKQLSFDAARCLHCGQCAFACPRGGIAMLGTPPVPVISAEKCALCGNCSAACATHGGGALSMQGEMHSVEDVVEEVLQDRVFYETSGGGMTFSGGECLEQIDFVEAVSARLREAGLHIACETSGYAEEGVFRRLLAAVDLLLFDVKHYEREKHIAGTGVDNAPILRNLDAALAAGAKVIVRIPVIPGYNDADGDAHAFGALLSAHAVEEAHLLPFHQYGSKKYEKLQMPYAYADVDSLQPKDLTPMEKILSQYVPHVQIGG